LHAKAWGFVAVLVGLVLAAAALGSATAEASTEVLVNQLPGPSGVAVPAEETTPWGGPYDDFVVPLGAHWHLSAIQVFGTGTAGPRTFTVRIYCGCANDESPLLIEELREFEEQVTVTGGPDYLIPIEGAPRFDADDMSLIPGFFWISVQAVDGGEGEWSWLTGPNTPGTGDFNQYRRGEAGGGGEPGLAFQLLGTATQTVKAQVSGPGTLVSNPPGISCPGNCSAEFPRGMALTFTQTALNPATKFIEWGFRNTGYSGPSGALSPIVIPSPCSGSAGCSFTLSSDTNVGAVFEPINEIDVLRVVRDRRTGKGQLLVWVPGPGQLTLFSEGLRSYFPAGVASGLVRVPLIPTRQIAKSLRRKHHVTVSGEVSYRPAGASVPTVTQLPLTLVRKASHKPTHRVH
jgi:hypothetical protein